MSSFTNEEIELCFVREFSAGAESFGPDLTRPQRRERIRVAILRDEKDGRNFYDSGMTYAEAYRRCFGVTLEMRRETRTYQKPVAQVIAELDDEADDEADDDLAPIE